MLQLKKKQNHKQAVFLIKKLSQEIFTIIHQIFLTFKFRYMDLIERVFGVQNYYFIVTNSEFNLED